MLRIGSWEFPVRGQHRIWIFGVTVWYWDNIGEFFACDIFGLAHRLWAIIIESFDARRWANTLCEEGTLVEDFFVFESTFNGFDDGLFLVPHLL